jgi:D-serine deaminase-like pyridoxal phosphate-dependent protein
MAFLPAALVISRVVSLVNETTLCLDLGHKAIAAENALERRVHFLNEPGTSFIAQSEEHLVVSLPSTHTYKPGDVWYGVPFHVCPTCALYDTAPVIEKGLVKDEWQIKARSRKISI